MNPNHDAASRRAETIDKSVQHWFGSGLLRPGMKVLDLGCGPGLYAQRLWQAGAAVVGLDISERSLAYAREHAGASGAAIEYRCMDFLTMDYAGEFDAVIQVYGELCTFADETRDRLLQSIHRALKKDGIFLFDLSTRELRARVGVKNGWSVSEGGFWRPSRHLVLEQGFDYPEEAVWLDQYIVADDQGCKVYRNWFHDYSLESIEPVLKAAGFRIAHVWNDLTGTPFAAGGDWMAIAAVKE
ncbi:MAG: class I SAM-dependent methyltransferase [Mycobacterium leprae]